VTRRPEVSSLTTAQMVEVDRAMLEDFRIGLVQMMENAGRNLAHLARSRFLAGDPRGRRVAVLAGTGGNGGGALVAARRLHCWGADVRVFVTAEDAAFTPVPARQLDIVRRMGIPVARSVAVIQADPELILDGLIGYSLRGAPTGDAAGLIRWANGHAAPVLSLDVPSGVDASTGVAHEPAVVATATMTLALPKQGLRAAGVAGHVGELYLADISVPPSLYAGPTLGLDIGPVFALEEIIRLA
jgi:NAD(P)H-hydrate epimerase